MLKVVSLGVPLAEEAPFFVTVGLMTTTFACLSSPKHHEGHAAEVDLIHVANQDFPYYFTFPVSTNDLLHIC